VLGVDSGDPKEAASAAAADEEVAGVADEAAALPPRPQLPPGRELVVDGDGGNDGGRKVPPGNTADAPADDDDDDAAVEPDFGSESESGSAESYGYGDESEEVAAPPSVLARNAIVVATYFLCPALMSHALGALDCFPAGDGVHYLVDAASIQCWTGEHVVIAAIAIASAIALFVCPVIWAFVQVARRAHSGVRGSPDDRDAIVFAFLEAGYRPGFFGVWEAVVILRKSLLAALVVGLGHVPDVQARVALWVLLAFLLAQVLLRPYEKRLAQGYETAAQLLIYISVLASLSFREGDKLSVDTIAALLLTAHIAFVAVSLILVIRLGLRARKRDAGADKDKQQCIAGKGNDGEGGDIELTML
jgi:hypothetical protein